MKRRDFLKTIPLGAAATAIPFIVGSRKAEALMNSPLLSALSNPLDTNDRALVIIFLEGGNDGLNTLVPFEDPLYDLNRKNLGFTTSAEKSRLTFKVRPDLAFNPNMNALEPLWKEGKMAIVQNLGIENPDLSHFRGLEIWNSSSDSDLIIPTGWAARYLQMLSPDYPATLPTDPLAINMGTLGSQIFRGSTSMVDVQVPNPLSFTAAANIGDDPLPNTEGGNELGFVREIVNISNVYAKRFAELFPASAQSTVQYPDTDFARNLQHIAWCIKSGIKTKIYFTNLIGFDTHFNQHSKETDSSEGHGLLLRILSQALVAFQRDLEGLGIADRVVTMTYSEFGRRVSENGDYASGTDHGTSAPHFVIGTSVNGELYGHHPDLATLDKNGDPINEFEFRRYYAAMLGDWFGLDESLRTSILSPGRNHDPFDIVFPINGTSQTAHLIDRLKTSVTTPQNTATPFSISVSPNPAGRVLTTQYVSSANSPIILELFDLRGRSIERFVKPPSIGIQYHSFDTHLLPSGVYYLHIRSGSMAETAKCIVKH